VRVTGPAVTLQAPELGVALGILLAQPLDTGERAGRFAPLGEDVPPGVDVGGRALGPVPLAFGHRLREIGLAVAEAAVMALEWRWAGRALTPAVAARRLDDRAVLAPLVAYAGPAVTEEDVRARAVAAHEAQGVHGGRPHRVVRAGFRGRGQQLYHTVAAQLVDAGARGARVAQCPQGRLHPHYPACKESRGFRTLSPTRFMRSVLLRSL
jgi:hypothetical protein